MKIVNRIEVILDLLALNQQQLADKIGFHRSQLNRIIRGSSVPRLDTAYKISRALGFPLNKVFLLKTKGENDAEFSGEKTCDGENADREAPECEDEKNEIQTLQID